MPAISLILLHRSRSTQRTQLPSPPPLAPSKSTASSEQKSKKSQPRIVRPRSDLRHPKHPSESATFMHPCICPVRSRRFQAVDRIYESLAVPSPELASVASLRLGEIEG